MLVLDGPMNGSAFLACVEQRLALMPGRGDVVVMDNLGVHKVAGVAEAIRPSAPASSTCPLRSHSIRCADGTGQPMHLQQQEAGLNSLGHGSAFFLLGPGHP